ncbi:hypothetical protein ACHAQA_007321 [Verticillium albo-atrum]
MSQHYTAQRGNRASGGRSNAGQPQSSGPKSFRCDIGGEWKPLDGFSKKFQRLAEKTNFNPAKSGMICRVHSGEPALEAKCEGPCGRILPLNSFSKSSRTHGVIYCIQCQSWISTQHAENGRTPYAAPHHERDIDEQQCGIGLPMMPEAYAEVDTDDDDDEDVEEILAPATGMANRSFRYGSSEASSFQGRTASIIAPSVSTAPREAVSHRAPPHLQGSQSQSNITSGVSESGSVTHAGWVPPHLRGAESGSTESGATPAQAPANLTNDHEGVRQQFFVSAVRAGDDGNNLMTLPESGPSTSPGLIQPQQHHSADQSSVQSANEYYKTKGTNNRRDEPTQPVQVTRAQKSGVPPHLQGPSSSAGRQTPRSNRWGKSSESRISQSDVQTISTATTVRQQRANQAFYNAWDDTGARHARPVAPPSTTTDGGNSVFMAVTAQQVPTPNTGGFARGYSAQTARDAESAAEGEVQNNFSKMTISKTSTAYNFDSDGSGSDVM